MRHAPSQPPRAGGRTGDDRTVTLPRRQAQSPGAKASSLGVETPSGKGARDENFPVASRLIASELRPHVMAFYDFVRAADDIADNPALAPEDKLARLHRMEASLAVDGPLDKPRRLAESLGRSGVTDRHVRDMLSAFRQDATKTRYANSHELWDYCSRSAAPVGRYLIDLHGEASLCYRGAEALSEVLQVLNHIQDCQRDYRKLDHVYLPLDLLRAAGGTVDDLDRPLQSAALRTTFDGLLEECARRLEETAPLASALSDRRFAAEVTLTYRLASQLARKLKDNDPLARRVALSKIDFAVAGVMGMTAFLVRR